MHYAPIGKLSIFFCLSKLIYYFSTIIFLLNFQCSSLGKVSIFSTFFLIKRGEWRREENVLCDMFIKICHSLTRLVCESTHFKEGNQSTVVSIHAAAACKLGGSIIYIF